jgi:EpsI family protein
VIFGLVFRLAEKDGLFYSLWAHGDHRMHGSPWALRPASVLLAAIMLGAGVGFAGLHHVAAVPLAKDLRALPVEIGRWEFRSAGSSFGALENLRFDDRLSRGYTASDGAELKLFLGYFRTQEQGRELVGYTVRSALGAGARSAYPLLSGEPQVVSDFLTGNGSETFHVTYWYVLDGQVVSSEYQARLRTAWDSLVHRRSNGGMVIVKTRTRQGESIEIARARIRDFLQTFVAMSKDYFPRS